MSTGATNPGWRALPIGRKFTLITMLCTGVALALAGGLFAGYDYVRYRAGMVSDVRSTAKMIGDNSAAALSFDDPASALQTLKSLAANPHIEGGAIYDRNGVKFSGYLRPGSEAALAKAPGPDGERFGEDRLESFSGVELAGERAGTVYLRVDLAGLHSRLWQHLLITLLVMGTASLVALLLVGRLKRLITGPIAHLATVAEAVTRRQDYGLRAEKQTDDELGQLIAGFNAMLGEVQRRDLQLQRAQESLEQRVAERTKELEREVTVRLQSEHDLLESNHRFEIVTGVTTDVIWDWNLTTDDIWWNPNFREVFGGKGSNKADWLERIHPDDVGKVEDGIRAVLTGTQSVWSAEYRFRREDGNYATVFDRGVLQRDAAGRPIRLVGAMQDITERRLAEAKLEATNRELVDTSRRAGQADVATSVLHNVGNVLNSVIVAATLTVEQVRKSRVENIAAVGRLLRENEAELGRFFTVNPKGRALLEYLPQLSASLVTEREAVLAELDGVVKNTEHIRAIISTQQAFAKSVGMLEHISMGDILEHALAMNADSLTRHSIRVERRFEPVPVFAVDKHRVLQVLVNLVRNAKDALKAAGGPGPHVITAEVGPAAADKVRVRISDNGIGIAADNLSRIFQHGFTTRRDGHGFGLHSGALTAQQLGGTLAVSSAGKGLGATFTLELPARAV